MLHLLQIMHYMLTKLEYTPEEVQIQFMSIERGENTIDDLLYTLGIEFGTLAHVTLVEKFSKWPSALNVIKMRLGIE